MARLKKIYAAGRYSGRPLIDVPVIRAGMYQPVRNEFHVAYRPLRSTIQEQKSRADSWSWVQFLHIQNESEDWRKALGAPKATRRGSNRRALAVLEEYSKGWLVRYRMAGWVRDTLK